MELSTENHFEVEKEDVENNKMNENINIDLQITQLILKSGSFLLCKVCGKTSTISSHMREHAEMHIEGISQACHICNISLKNRASLRRHINRYHTEQERFSCDICGKSGLIKSSYFQHMSRKHKTLSKTL